MLMILVSRVDLFQWIWRNFAEIAFVESFYSRPWAVSCRSCKILKAFWKGRPFCCFPGCDFSINLRIWSLHALFLVDQRLCWCIEYIGGVPYGCLPSLKGGSWDLRRGLSFLWSYDFYIEGQCCTAGAESWRTFCLENVEYESYSFAHSVNELILAWVDACLKLAQIQALCEFCHLTTEFKWFWF